MITLTELLSKGYVKTDDFHHEESDGTEWNLLIMTDPRGNNIVYDPDSKSILGCYRYREREESELERIRNYDHS
jgi:hypothetical protein